MGGTPFRRTTRLFKARNSRGTWSEETGVAKVRDLLENHPPLLASVIKHLPTLERLSMMRYQLSPDQVPRLLRALKRQVVRRNGVLTVQAKHVGWSSTYPANTDKDALASLIDKLEKSKRVKCTFTEATGVSKWRHPSRREFCEGWATCLQQRKSSCDKHPNKH